MAPIVKAALIQLHSQPLELELNFQRAADFVRDAAKQGADLAVLPEYGLSNWCPNSPKFEQCVTDGSPYLARYQALAAECKICLVPGTVLEWHLDPNSEKRNIQNATYFISSNGDILGRYHKKNIWIPERPFISSSTTLPHEVFDTPIGKVGLLICWDLAFPEAFRELIAKGAEIIIVPSFWGVLDSAPHGPKLNPKVEQLFLDSFITTRAFENTCAVIFVNGGDARTGEKGEEVMSGRSQVALPFVGASGEHTMNSSQEGMSLVDIDLDIVRKAEDVYQIRTDIGRKDWYYTYRHQAKAML